MRYLYMIAFLLAMLYSCYPTSYIDADNYTLSYGERSGSISGRDSLYSILRSVTSNILDSSNQLVIFYYPGKDRCNYSGGGTRKGRKLRYNEIEKRINKIANTNFAYIYKDSVELYGRNDGYKKWYEDPENVLESFFEPPPYCMAYILLSDKSDFISYSGEYDVTAICENFDYLMSLRNKD